MAVKKILIVVVCTAEFTMETTLFQFDFFWTILEFTEINVFVSLQFSFSKKATTIWWKLWIDLKYI